MPHWSFAGKYIILSYLFEWGFPSIQDTLKVGFTNVGPCSTPMWGDDDATDNVTSSLMNPKKTMSVSCSSPFRLVLEEYNRQAPLSDIQFCWSSPLPACTATGMLHDSALGLYKFMIDVGILHREPCRNMSFCFQLQRRRFLVDYFYPICTKWKQEFINTPQRS